MLRKKFLFLPLAWFYWQKEDGCLVLEVIEINVSLQDSERMKKTLENSRN